MESYLILAIRVDGPYDEALGRATEMVLESLEGYEVIVLNTIPAPDSPAQAKGV